MYPRPATAGNRSSSRTCPTSEPWCAGSVSLGAIGNGCALAAQCVARGPKSLKFDAEQKCLKTACYPAGWVTLSWQGAILRPSDTPQFKRCPPIVADAAAPRNAKNPIAQEFSAGIQRRISAQDFSAGGAAWPDRCPARRPRVFWLWEYQIRCPPDPPGQGQNHHP